jgi:hypothetical protein
MEYFSKEVIGYKNLICVDSACSIKILKEK